MGIKTRHKRLEHFEERAGAFYEDVKELGEGEAYRKVKRDGKAILVGVGKHERLCLKRNPRHVQWAQDLQNLLLKSARSGLIRPEHYELVAIGGSADTGVQEYFHKPSMYQLKRYLEIKKDESSLGRPLRITEFSQMADDQYLTREDVLLCRQFMKQFTGVTLEKLENAGVEFDENLFTAGFRGVMQWANIIVLGQNRDGRIRLALADA
ncbi:MAG: hypothetical protein V1703_03580 [Candidatus Altiarchaeota archaeon]